jgi:F0F1-type ATP synthase assembly protein I
MIGIILAGVYGGYKLDQYVGTEKPWFTALFAVVAVALAVYFSIRDLIK